MSGWELSAAFAVVTLGAVVQGSIGFGLGLVAAPLLALIDPALIPAPMIATTLVFTILMTRRERASVDLRAVRWALVGRLPGVALGLVVVATLPEDDVGLAFGLLVLAAVAMSATGLALTPTPPTLFGAGLVSGLMGTVSSIGGPPVAMLYQHAPGAELRGTLAGYFLVGSTMSLIGLALVGRFAGEELLATAVLLPGIAAGFILSAYTARLLDRGYIRLAVLVLSGTSAVVVVLTEVLG